MVHTDIKADNILDAIVDKRILDAFTNAELATPSARKVVNGHTIYRSRQFELLQQFGDVVLGDLGSAVKGDERRNHDAQPQVYRSPEMMLKVDWSYPVDIWNVGCMIWDLFEGRHVLRRRSGRQRILNPRSPRRGNRVARPATTGFDQTGCPK